MLQRQPTWLRWDRLITVGEWNSWWGEIKAWPQCCQCYQWAPGNSSTVVLEIRTWDSLWNRSLDSRVSSFQGWSCLSLICLVSPMHGLSCLFYIHSQPHHSRSWGIYPRFWDLQKNDCEIDSQCPPKSLAKKPSRPTILNSDFRCSSSEESKPYGWFL